MAGDRELDTRNLLEMAPVRLARWHEIRGRVILWRPGPRGWGLRGLRDRLVRFLKANRIRLDEVGSHAWLHLDGQRTVAEVASELRHHFGDRAEPAEERLGQLVRVLRKERFLAYPGWDRLPPEPGKGGDSRTG
jgi:hypothetical protein